MTPALEERFGQAWAAMARREGHYKALPAGGSLSMQDRARMGAKTQAAMARRAEIKRIYDSGTTSAARIAAHFPGTSLVTICNDMRQLGLKTTRTNAKGN